MFDTAAASVITPGKFLLCVGVSLVMGLILCLMVLWRSRSSESFAITLVLLPASVCVVIMMVNGNIGAGVAVAGAFGLVRFRSAAGTGREISAVFIAMGAGLIAGMGYLAYAVLFALVLGLMMMACNGNGNTALDSESGVTNNGADVTTNDGSENSTGFGGRGGRGQMGGDPGRFGGKDKMGVGSNSQTRQ